MDSLHLVDPVLRPLLNIFPTIDITNDNLAALRARELPLTPSGNDGITLQQFSVAGPSGAPPIGLRYYQPTNTTEDLSCIYHVHGGGFVAGAANQMEEAHRSLAAELGCAIVSVDYRLAPETVFPGAIEDCYAGLGWTMAHARDLGIEPTRVGVMGESAGGGLAAALALMVRDRGEHSIVFQHLIYPMLDDRTCVAADPHPFAGEFIWHPANNRFGWTSLLGHQPGQAGVSPHAAPARATDLAGLPPTFISTGALDLFVEEDMEYARRLLRAGVPTELHVYPGAFHGFDMMPGADVAAAARRDSRAALAKFIRP